MSTPTLTEEQRRRLEPFIQEANMALQQAQVAQQGAMACRERLLAAIRIAIGDDEAGLEVLNPTVEEGSTQ
jgi:hypothetical protein